MRLRSQEKWGVVLVPLSKRDYSARRWAVAIGVAILAAGALWRDLPSSGPISLGWLATFFLLALAAAHMEMERVSLGPAGSFSPAPMLLYVLVLTFGPWALIPTVIWSVSSWKGVSGKIFNLSQRIVYASTGKLVFVAFSAWGQGHWLRVVFAHAMAISAFIIVNLTLVSLMKIASGEGTWPVLWHTYYAPIIPTYFDNLIQGSICMLVIDYMGWIGGVFAVYLAYSKLMVQASVVGGAIGKALSAESLIEAIDAKDSYTKDHSARVSRHAQAIAHQLHLPAATVSDIVVASKLHDIGKIATPDVVLQKAGPLSDEEFQLVQEHPLKSQQILAANPQLSRIAVIVSQHHERYDGRGYPQGLKRDAICLEARIIACADAFDAMTTDRPYRKALNVAAAILELRTHRGTQFDPEVVNALLTHLGAELDASDTLIQPVGGCACASLARLSVSQDES